MEYRTVKKNDDKISLLGFGAMRLIQKNGKIDMDLASQVINYAIDNGINYFDTAFLYGMGSNEKALGEIILKCGCRNDVYLATKMNRLAIHSRDDMEKMFKQELDNLCTDYIDYYFIHNVISYQDIIDLIDMGLFDFIEDKKSNGQIINIGFSYHGSYGDFEKILELYDWDMTLLQYNYLDNQLQAGLRGIKLAHQKDMGVIIMEPLKGGLLAGTMPKQAQDLIDKSTTQRSNVDLALSWIYDTPELTCVLSGMNTMEMLEENIEITDNFTENPLNPDEKILLEQVKDVILEINKIGCTTCNYCMPCPQQINIPDIFKLYNDKYLFPEDKTHGIHHTYIQYAGNMLGFTGQRHDGALCIDCGLCTSKCPQRLEIPKLLKMVDKSYHGNLLRPIVPVAKKLMKRFM